MAEGSRHGYLVLADISGYSSFLTKVELELAHEILTDLMEMLVSRLKSLLTISKLEGDAVLAYIDEEKLPRAETLKELIENTCSAFRRQRDTSKCNTTCTCHVCQSMNLLELKFFIHHGDFMVQNMAGIKELVGSGVNLIHRLTKNHITENTGWNAYSLFTQRAMKATRLQLEDVHKQNESYEHLGEVETVTINLLPLYEQYTAAQNFSITEENAYISVSHPFKDLTETELWQVITSSNIQHAISKNTVTWSDVFRPGGRTGVGAVNHSPHGKGEMKFTYLDWKPFKYMTGRGGDGSMSFLQMYEFIPLPDENATRMIFRWKFESNLPDWLCSLMGTVMLKKEATRFIANLEEYIQAQRQPTFQPEVL